MPRSFLLHNGPVAPDPAETAHRLAPYETGYSAWSSGRTTLWTNGSYPIQPVFQGKGPEFFLFGEEPADYHKEAVARFLETGVSALSDYELHGAWIVLEGDALYLYNGRLGETPVYYCRGASDLLIATEIKALAGQRVVPVRLMAVEDMAALPYFPDASITLAGHVRRLVPGNILRVDLKRLEIRLMPVPEPFVRPPATVTEAADRLYDALEQEIIAASKGPRIGIPLSGGCDSAAVAAIAARHAPDVSTFTIGTSGNNEFGEARETAAYLGLENLESAFAGNDLLPAVVEGIFYNELADPLYAIGYAGLYFAFRAAEGRVDRLLTGYGADLTLSNFLGGTAAEQNKLAEKLLARTAWTGELHSGLAARFGLEVRHPFLSRRVARLILSMPVDFRTRLANGAGIDKYVEKHMIEKFGLMPPGLIHREKQALHTGAGIPGLFTQEVEKWGKPGDGFNLRFLHHAWKRLIFNGTRPDECDIGELVTESLTTT